MWQEMSDVRSLLLCQTNPGQAEEGNPSPHLLLYDLKEYFFLEPGKREN